MNKPELYHKAHRALKIQVGALIKEYSALLQWLPEGGDAVLDVGTGPGDVSMDYIYPLLPPNIGKIVFTDISAHMLDYARAYYGIPEKSEFKVFDIATKKGLSSEWQGKFDHITSMLVMHWVKDTRMALANTFNLLRPVGGDCLMIFMSYNNIFAANHAMSKCPKWSRYIKDVEPFISPLNYSTDPRGEFATMMTEAGFCNITMDMKSFTGHYDGDENFKENIKPVCGILDFIPISRQTEFLDDYTTAMAECGAQRCGLNPTQCKNTVICDLIVAYGQKAPTKEGT